MNNLFGIQIFCMLEANLSLDFSCHYCCQLMAMQCNCFEEVIVLDDWYEMDKWFRIQIFCILKAYLSSDHNCHYCLHLCQDCIDDGELVDWHGTNKLFGIQIFCILELTFPKIALIIGVIIFVIGICVIIVNFLKSTSACHKEGAVFQFHLDQ